MKGLVFKRKNLIALTLVAAVVAVGMGVKVQASEKIDTTKSISVTAVGDPSSAFAQNFGQSIAGEFVDGYEVQVDMYKIAAFDEGGTPTLTDPFKSDINKINLSVLSSDAQDKDKQVAAIDKNIVEPAVSIVKANNKAADATINVKRENGKLAGSTQVTSGIGIYLYIPKDTEDELNVYKFKPFVVSLPTSNYISQSTKVDANGNVVATDDSSDTWIYDVTIALKAEVEPKLASLEIKKFLQTFNKSLGTASFVFDVEAYDSDKKVVFSNVYSLSFDGRDTKSILIENQIPAGSEVVVTEVYSGASYDIVDGDSLVKTIEHLPANETTLVEFNNDYTRLIREGDIAIENHFVKEKNNAGVKYRFDSNNLPKDDTTNQGVN